MDDRSEDRVAVERAPWHVLIAESCKPPAKGISFLELEVTPSKVFDLFLNDVVDVFGRARIREERKLKLGQPSSVAWTRDHRSELGHRQDPLHSNKGLDVVEPSELKP